MRNIFLTSATFIIAMTIGPGAHAANLLSNGNFSDGNTGFESGYTYAAPSYNALYPEGLYTVASNPHAVHQYWVDLSGPTERLIVNGAVSSTPFVWEEDNIATVAGKSYDFSGSVANICCNSTFLGENDPSEILFQISTNDGASFQTLDTLMTHPPGDAGQFQTASIDFTAAGPTDFRIADELNGQSGNDFAIENLAVSAAPEPSIWILMLAGIGGIGFILRQAKKVSGLRFKDSFPA